MRNFLFGILAALFFVPIATIAFYAFGFAEVRADIRPSWLENRIMIAAVHNSVRRSASGIANSNSPDRKAVVAGGKLYVAGCMGCHGDPAKPFSEDLSSFPPVPQLPHVGTQYSEPELYWIVKHGIRMTAMSAYGPFYSEEKLWAIAAFVHQIKGMPPDVLAEIQAK